MYSTTFGAADSSFFDGTDQEIPWLVSTVV